VPGHASTGTDWSRARDYAVNLPELLAHTAMDPESAGILRENMAQFLWSVTESAISCSLILKWSVGDSDSWLDLNRSILFVKDYESTSSGYQNNNRV
jgi:mortality factor 4-like protein 1